MKRVTFYLVSFFTMITLHEKKKWKEIKAAEPQGDKMKPCTLSKGDEQWWHHPHGGRVWAQSPSLAGCIVCSSVWPVGNRIMGQQMAASLAGWKKAGGAEIVERNLWMGHLKLHTKFRFRSSAFVKLIDENIPMMMVFWSVITSRLLTCRVHYPSTRVRIRCVNNRSLRNERSWGDEGERYSEGWATPILFIWDLRMESAPKKGNYIMKIV